MATTRRPTTPTQTLPVEWNETSEEILGKIIALAQAESRRILDTLQADPGFSESTPRQQAKTYAAAVGGKMPWAVLLHQARNGEIQLDIARRLFKNHTEVQN